VKDLVWENNQVVGVTTNSKDEIKSDLVIDARGAQSKDFDKLPSGIIETMETNVHYYSIICKIPKIYLEPYKCYMSRRTGIDILYVFPIENDNYLVTYGGFSSIKEDILEYVKTIDYYSDGYRIISKMEPVTKWTHGYQNKWWFRSRDPVKGFLEIGDRNCRVVPIYGTGMTMSAKQANILFNSDEMNFNQNVYKILSRSWKNYQYMFKDISKYQGTMIKNKTLFTKVITNLAMSANEINEDIANNLIGFANYLEEHGPSIKEKQYQIIYYGILNLIRRFFIISTNYFRAKL
jgi:flavin-dependent dehydrogenase